MMLDSSKLPLPLVLASASPRRQALLRFLIDDFSICCPDIDESPLKNETPKKLVERLAKSKAQAILAKNKQNLVLGSDTIVVADKQVLGKPRDFEHFAKMLTLLTAKTHKVYTAVCIASHDVERICVACTNVTMGHISKDEMLAYWQTGEPRDKAGGYAIQGIGGQYIRDIKGSHSAVIGLPLYETKALLESFLAEDSINK